MGSATDQHRVNLFQSCGATHVLVSYATILGKVKINIPFENVIMDSGAYSIATSSMKANQLKKNLKYEGFSDDQIKIYNESTKNSTNEEYLRGYILWLQLNLSKYPQIKHYVNLDDLGNPFQTECNQLYMESEGLKPLPVYHYGEPIEVLDKMCTEYEYVGLGGIAVGTTSWQTLRKFWEMVYHKFKDNKFHLFGVGTVQPFFYYQPYSIDSTSWNVGAIYGDLMCYRNGVPYRLSVGTTSGYNLFFDRDQLLLNNIRAQIDWGKCEWVKNVKPRGSQMSLMGEELE